MTIRSQILSMQEIPSIGKVYALMKQEEKQNINIREKVSSSNITKSAHWAKKATEKDENLQERGRRYTKSGKKLNTKFFFEHCNYYGHVKEKCWHLIGYPKKKNEGKENEDWKNKKVKVETTNSATALSEEEYKLIKDFILKSGENFFSFTSTNISNSEWICDSRASQDMSGFLEKFTNIHTPNSY